MEIRRKPLQLRRLAGAALLAFLALWITRGALGRGHLGAAEYLVIVLLDAILLRAALRISRGAVSRL
jgi:hypothetical protein